MARIFTLEVTRKIKKETEIKLRSGEEHRKKNLVPQKRRTFKRKKKNRGKAVEVER